MLNKKGGSFVDQKDSLLTWCVEKTKGYEGVEIKSLKITQGDCWQNGLAFCALVHSCDSTLLDFDSLSGSNAKHNLSVAFKLAEEKLNVPSMMDPEDVVAAEDFKRPDDRCMYAYLWQFKTNFPVTKLRTVHSASSFDDIKKQAAIDAKAARHAKWREKEANWRKEKKRKHEQLKKQQAEEEKKKKEEEARKLKEEQERKENERIERERQEKQRKEREEQERREERERKEKEQAEKERKAKEAKEDKERKEKDAKEKERQDKERKANQEREKKEQLEKRKPTEQPKPSARPLPTPPAKQQNNPVLVPNGSDKQPHAVPSRSRPPFVPVQPPPQQSQPPEQQKSLPPDWGTGTVKSRRAMFEGK